MWRDKIQISRKCGKPVPIPAKTNVSLPSPVRCHRHTDFFGAICESKKRHSLTFKCKITTSANYTDGIGTGYMYVSRQRNMSALNKT